MTMSATLKWTAVLLALSAVSDLASSDAQQGKDTLGLCADQHCQREFPVERKVVIFHF